MYYYIMLRSLKMKPEMLVWKLYTMYTTYCIFHTFRKNRTLETKLKINCKNTFFANCFYCERLSNEMNINHAHFAADIQVSNTPMCLWSAVASFIEVLRQLEKSTTKMSSFVAVTSKYLQSVPFQINSWILLFKNVLFTVIVALSCSILCVNKTDEVDRKWILFLILYCWRKKTASEIFVLWG